MKYTYLLINIFTVLVPLIRSFEPRINFFSRWKYFTPAMLATALFFLVWDAAFTTKGVWQFNNEYVLGYYLFGLPVEEYLFFITVPYACTFVYETVTLLLKKDVFPARLNGAFIAAGVLSFVSSFLFIDKLYTFWVLLIMGIVLIGVTFLLKPAQLDKFLLAFIISLVPMLIVNGLLTGLPVLIYNNTENCDVRLGTIPVEDFAYNMILLCMNIGLYKFLEGKKSTPHY